MQQRGGKDAEKKGEEGGGEGGARDAPTGVSRQGCAACCVPAVRRGRARCLGRREPFTGRRGVPRCLGRAAHRPPWADSPGTPSVLTPFSAVSSLPSASVEGREGEGEGSSTSSLALEPRAFWMAAS